MKDILLCIPLIIAGIYGYFVIKKVDKFINEIRVNDYKPPRINKHDLPKRRK